MNYDNSLFFDDVINNNIVDIDSYKSELFNIIRTFFINRIIYIYAARRSRKSIVETSRRNQVKNIKKGITP